MTEYTIIDTKNKLHTLDAINEETIETVSMVLFTITLIMFTTVICYCRTIGG